MRPVTLLLILMCTLTLCACAGKDVTVQPKGEVVVGGSVGHSSNHHWW